MTSAQWHFVAKFIQFWIHLRLKLEATDIWSIVKDTAFLQKCNKAFTSEKTTHSCSLEKSYRKSRWLYSRWGRGAEGIVCIWNQFKILRFPYLMCKLGTFKPFNDLIFFPGVWEKPATWRRMIMELQNPSLYCMTYCVTRSHRPLLKHLLSLCHYSECNVTEFTMCNFHYWTSSAIATSS